MPDRITYEEILALASEREEVYGPMWAAMRKDWDCIIASASWRNALIPEYVKGFPANYTPKVPPIAKKALELFRTTVMVGEEPEVKIPLPKGMRSSKENRRKRTAMEDFAKAWVYNAATLSGINPFVDILNKQGGLGMGGICAAFDFEKWPKPLADVDEETLEEYEKKKKCFPWKVSVISPRGFMPDPWHDPPEDYIIKDKLNARVARKLYPHLTAAAEKGKLERLIYCSKTDYAVYIGAEAALAGGVEDNPMGDLWYETVWSGNGELKEDNEVEFLGQGIIRNARDTIAMIVQAINVAEIKRNVAAFTPLHYSAEDKTEAEEAARATVFGPDAILATSHRVKIETFPQADMPREVVWTNEQMIMWLRIIYGQDILSGASTTDTATTLMKNISLAEAPFKPMRVNAEQAWANVLRKVFRFLANELHDEQVSLPYRDGAIMTLNRADIIEGCPIEVNYKPPTDEERAFNAARDAQLLELHQISPEEFRRRQGIEEDEEEQQKILEGLLMYHDAVVGASAMVIANQIAPQPTPTGVVPEVPGVAQNGAGSDQRMQTSPQQVAVNQAQKMYEVPLGTQ